MKQWLARKLLTLTGWTLEGEKPLDRRYVLIAAPHTSNWDFPLMLLFGAAFDIKITWMGKQSLFWPPLSWFLRATGGMPIQRNSSNNVVDAMVETFSRHRELVLVVPTEGTRDRADYWKSGFYHIARKAGIPIVPSYLDFGRRRGGFGPARIVTGDIVSDMQYFRNFYAPMKGKFPGQVGPIRLRDEE